MPSPPISSRGCFDATDLCARELRQRLLGAVHAAVHEIAAAGNLDREQLARLVELQLDVGAGDQRGAEPIARNHRQALRERKRASCGGP